MDKKIYSKGEIIWAKVSGFPWWPGIIHKCFLKHKKKRNEEGEIIVYYDKQVIFDVEFILDHSHGEISADKIEYFYTKFKERTNTKNKKLLQAIGQARKMFFEHKKNLSPLITYELLGKKRIYKANKKKGKVKQMKNEEMEMGMADDSASSEGDCNGYKRGKVVMGDSFGKERYEKGDKGTERKQSNIEKSEQCTEGMRGKQRKKSQEKPVRGNEKIKVWGSKLAGMESKSETNTNNTNLSQKVTPCKTGTSAIKLSKNKSIPYIIGDYHVPPSTNNTNNNNPKKSINPSLFSESQDNESQSSVVLSQSCPEKISNSRMQQIASELLRNKIEHRGKEPQRQIISLLDETANILSSKSLPSSTEIYTLGKEFIPLLTSFTSSNSQDIVVKCVDIIGQIKDLLINEVFGASSSEINYLASAVDDSVGKEEIIKLINNQWIPFPSSNNVHNNNTKDTPKIKSKNDHDAKSRKEPEQIHTPADIIDKDRKGIRINIENTDIVINREFIASIFKTIMTDELGEEKEKIPKGVIYPNYFYENIYSKVNYWDEQNALYRKRVCLKLYNLIKIAVPKYKEDSLKKSVVFFEYVARIKDPDFGEVYKEIIDFLCKEIKDTVMNHGNCKDKDKEYEKGARDE